MKRVLKLFPLVIRYGFDFIVANLTLAKQLLSPRMQIDPEIIEIETETRSPAEILALSNMITATPGTLTLDVEPGERLVVHVLSDGEEAADAIRERLEKPLLEITRPPSSS